MERKEIIKKFCALSTKVMREKFNYKVPADCFCDRHSKTDFYFDKAIVDFIELAVQEKLDREK